MRAPPGGWRALGAFWLLISLGLVAGGVTLHMMGPPEAPPTLAEPGPAEPASAPLAAPQAEAPPPTSPSEPPPAATAAQVPAATAAQNSAEAPPPVPAAPAPAATAAPAPAATAASASAAAAAQVPPATAAQAPAATAAPAPAVPPAPVAQAPAAATPEAPSPPPLPAGPVRALPQPDRPIAPPEAPLQEAGRYGPMPRIGPDGRTPVRVYARAFDRSDTRPRVAIVMGGLGLSASLSDDAIRRLPGAVGLAFSPYAGRVEALLDRARLRGMELISALPMEPQGYPLNDPGEWAMLTGITREQNLDRFEWSLSRLQGQVGAIGALGAMRGERFAAVPDLFNLIQDHLRSRGLLYIDPRPGAPQPERAWGRSVDLVIDEPPTRGEIELKLAALERIAREKGSALGLAADPAPVTVDRLAHWAATLAERGLVLAPVTALIRRPGSQPQ